MLRISRPPRPMGAAWCLSFALLGDTFLYVFLPLHALTVQVPGAWVGVLLSVNRFVRIAATPWMAGLFGRFGFRRLSVAAAGLAIVSTAGYGWGGGLAGWLLLRVGWGLAFAVLRISSLSYALDAPRPGLALGLSRSIQELGPMAALVLAPWLLAQAGPARTFGLLALGTLPALWFAWRLPERPAARVPAAGPRFKVPSLVNGLAFLTALAVEGLVVVAAGALLRQAYPGVGAGTLTGWVAGYLLLRRLCAIGLSPAGGWLADRYSFLKVYGASLAMVGLGLLLLAMGRAIAGLGLLAVFHSVNASLAVGEALAGQRPSAQAVAANVAWRDAGAAFGALLGGLLGSGLLPLTLLLSSGALLGLLAAYAGFSFQTLKTRLLWK